MTSSHLIALDRLYLHDVSNHYWIIYVFGNKTSGSNEFHSYDFDQRLKKKWQVWKSTEFSWVKMELSENAEGKIETVGMSFKEGT